METLKEIEESGEIFQIIANYTYDWESWFDPTGTVRWINPEVEKFTGYTVAECLAMPDYPLPCIHEDDRSKIKNLLADALQGSSGNHVTFRLHRKNKELAWMAISWQPMFNQENSFLGYRTSVRDISEQQQVKEKLSQFKQTLDNTLDCVFMFHDTTFRFSYVNQGAVNLVQYSATEMMNLTPLDIQPEYTVERFQTLITPLLDGSKPAVTFETVHQAKDGTVIPVEVFLQHFTKKESQGHFVAIVRDISERKEKQLTLKRFGSLIEYSNDFIGFTSLEGQALYLNQEGRRLVGLETLEEVRRTVIIDYIPTDLHPMIFNEVIPAVLEKGNWAGEMSFVHFKTKELIPVFWDVYRIDDPETGQPINFGTVTRNLSNLKKAQAEQERLQQEVIEAQQQMIQELSVPIIPIIEGVIIMPLIGSLDSHRARDLMRTLLQGISEHRAKIVILDITGVSIVDTRIAAHLDKTIQAARLKGANTIVSGVSDNVAETIIDLGIDWSNLQTVRDLQTGLVIALESLGLRFKR